MKFFMVVFFFFLFFFRGFICLFVCFCEPKLMLQKEQQRGEREKGGQQRVPFRSISVFHFGPLAKISVLHFARSAWSLSLDQRAPFRSISVVPFARSIIGYQN
jgi:hypothetical protein